MEPLADRELDELLKQWRAPEAPASLEERLGQARHTPWWKWLLTGTVRVPVPAALLAVLAFAITIFVAVRQSPSTHRSGGEFRAVRELQVRIIRSTYESSR